MAGSGRKVLSVAFVAEGIETVKREIVELGRTGAEAAARISAAFSKTQIGQQLSASLNRLKLRFADTIKAAQRFGNAWAGVGKSFKGFTEAVQAGIARVTKLTAAIGLAAFGVNRLLSAFGSSAEAITIGADAIGVTTDAYQRLQAAASGVGIEQNKLDKILQKFTIGVEEAGDEAEKAAKKGDGLGKSLERVAVTAQDGSTKFVTIRRGINDAKDSITGFGEITKKGIDGLLQYGKALEGLSTVEKLQRITKDFGAKGAAQTLALFESLTFQFDDTARAAAGVIKPLSELELAIGNEMDNAFDNLGQNLKIIGGRLGAVFAPAYTELIKAFTFWIKDNEQWLISWADTINDYALQVIRDFIAILRGAPDQVKNKWLIDLYNGALKFGRGVKYVFEEVLPKAFTKLREYADMAATKLNEIFGTNFTGDSLLVTIALGYVTGAFDIFIKAAILVGSTVYAVAQSFRLLAVAVRLVFAALRPVVLVLGYLATGIAALIGAPAWVGAAIVAALLIAGALIYVYWDEVKAYAQMTWDAIVSIAGSAIDSIAALFGKLPAEWSAIWQKMKGGDWQGVLDEVATQSATWWDEFIASTKTDVENINEALKYIGVDLPAVWDHIANGAKGIWEDIVSGASALRSRLTPAWEGVKASASDLWPGVEATARTIWNNVASIIETAATGIGNAVSKVWTAASEAISGATSSVADSAKGIYDSIGQAVAAAGDVSGAIELAGRLVEPFASARQDIEAVWDGLKPVLEGKGADIAAAMATALAPVKNLPTALLEAAQGIPGAIATIATQVTTGLNQMVGAAERSASAIGVAIQRALAGASLKIDLSGIVSTFQTAAQSIVSVWSGAMRSITSQTQSMVSAVQSLITRLASYLNALRAAIASAKASASSSSSKSSDGRAGRAVGGFITGPGSGTADKIPLWASNGEFMLKARAVKYWGLDMLYALNNMRMPRFAAGGMVGDMAAAVSPRGMYARPLDGAKSGLTPYTLVFEGKQYPGFMGPAPDALKQLGKARALSRVSTPNRVPKWKG